MKEDYRSVIFFLFVLLIIDMLSLNVGDSEFIYNKQCRVSL
jgi:hypothetical protein